MKIVFLNAWYGKLEKELVEFLKQQASSADIICLQEGTDRLKQLCDDVFSDFNSNFTSKYVSSTVDYYQLTYLKKSIELETVGTFFDDDKEIGSGSYIQFRVNGREVYVCNVHGNPEPYDKLDSPDRLKQSYELMNFFKHKPGLRIVGGDFNLLPDTESVQMFAKNGYRNLIRDFKIDTTRNHLAWDLYPGHEQYYADFVFVAGEAKIEQFTVPKIDVSDHLPMIFQITP